MRSVLCAGGRLAATLSADGQRVRIAHTDGTGAIVVTVDEARALAVVGLPAILPPIAAPAAPDLPLGSGERQTPTSTPQTPRTSRLF